MESGPRREGEVAAVYRSAGRALQRLVVGATFACPKCRLRFARRSACAACGAPLVGLADREGRATFAYGTKAPGARGGGGGGGGGGGSALAKLAAWAPERVWIPAAFGVCMIAPAIVARVMFGPTAFLQSWIDTRDLTITHEGLSADGVKLLLLAAAGAVLLAFTALTRWAASRTPPNVGPPPKLRVYEGATAPPATASPTKATPVTDEPTVLRGIARRGTIEIASPLAGTSCLAFGIFGATPRGDLADADGGDFDLELESGERVMVSLEHAALVIDADTRTSAGDSDAPKPDRDAPRRARDAAPMSPGDDGTDTGALDELLEARGLASSATENLDLHEVLLRDGDLVEVSGSFAAGGAVTLAGGQRARILTGSEDRPLAVLLNGATVE